MLLGRRKRFFENSVGWDLASGPTSATPAGDASVANESPRLVSSSRLERAAADVTHESRQPVGAPAKMRRSPARPARVYPTLQLTKKKIGLRIFTASPESAKPFGHNVVNSKSPRKHYCRSHTRKSPGMYYVGPSSLNRDVGGRREEKIGLFIDFFSDENLGSSGKRRTFGQNSTAGRTRERTTTLLRNT